MQYLFANAGYEPNHSLWMGWSLFCKIIKDSTTETAVRISGYTVLHDTHGEGDNGAVKKPQSLLNAVAKYQNCH